RRFVKHLLISKCLNQMFNIVLHLPRNPNFYRLKTVNRDERENTKLEIGEFCSNIENEILGYDWRLRRVKGLS
ncbi:unnamed protein product, partial [Candidula unifasciata]